MDGNLKTKNHGKSHGKDHLRTITAVFTYNSNEET